MSYESAWFIGSATIPAQTITVNGVAVVVPAGTYYLHDAIAGRSLLAQVAAAMLPQAAGATAVLTSSGKVRLAAAGAFSLDWGAAGTLRRLLGYSLNLAASAGYTAPGKSPLWWSPGKPALFALTPLGVTGSRRHIVSQTTAAYTGRAQSTSHGSRLYQRFLFEKVDAERMQTSDTAVGGEYDAWYQQVAVVSARFKVYPNAIEGDAGTGAFTSDAALGPYVQPLGGDASWKYERSAGMQWTDLCADVAITANGCPEIT